MDWFKNALGMAGAYTIARSILDGDEQKRAIKDYAEFQAWLRAGAVALGWRPEA